MPVERRAAVGTETMDDFRYWTRAEIDAAVAYVKAERPRLWRELQRLERAGKGLGRGDDDAGGILHRLLLAKHPDANSEDRAILMTHVRGRV